ncbi:hypothetical protein V6N13_101314 [Hibiscus sabdariffa]
MGTDPSTLQRGSKETKYEDSSQSSSSTSTRVSLVDWVWDLYGKQRLLDAADEQLHMGFDGKQMECLLMVGLWCVNPNPNLRPSINQANLVLNFEAPSPNLLDRMPIP